MSNESEDVNQTSQNVHHNHKSRSKNKSGWSVNKLFWGLLLVLVGGLMLASNFGLIDVKWANIWRLWPLIIISAGLSVMSFKSVVWRILMVLLVILSLGAITWVVIGDNTGLSPINSQNTSVYKISNDIKCAEISVKAGASVLKINSVNQKEVAKVRLDSNVATLAKNSNQSGENQQIEFSMTDVSNWWAGDVRNNWDVKLTNDLPLTLNVDAGASDTQIDTSSAQLDEMNIKAGASSLKVKLGSIENISNLNIDSGASSIVVKVPSGIGVKLKIEGGLTTNHLADLNETVKNTFQSPNYSQSQKQINITAKIGVSSFTIERY